ncbi:unnamed protein product [Rhizophagus irregularis]|nr:unnamed protein product [Rhizophagus irregularis]
MTKEDFKECGLSEVLAEYGLDSDGIDSILLFSPPTYEIQDENKVFKRCMEEILDITNKELSMRLQYGIEAEDLICITEDKQHKISVGFAQNIKQLKSAYETNRRKKKRGENDFMVSSQQVEISSSFYIALEKYPRRVTLHIRSNLPRRP